MAGYKEIKPRWKKGESGNLAGRPKLPELRTLLDEILGEEKDGKTAAFAILAALRAKAAKGDIRAAEVLLNRGYGLPKQHIEHSGSIETPITLTLDERFKDNAGIP